jgi:hypothetical protein
MKIEISLNIRPVKKKHKIQIDCHMLEFILPGSGKLDVLPRKKKKALKKKIAVDLIRYIDENADELMARMDELKRNGK